MSRNKNNKLDELLSQIRGDQNIQITWQEVVKGSSHSFYVEGCGNAFFHYQNDEYFAIVENSKLVEGIFKVDFKVFFLCKLKPSFIGQLNDINDEMTFTKDHFETLNGILGHKKLTREAYAELLNTDGLMRRMHGRAIFKLHYPKKMCYIFGHKFSHSVRQKFIEEYRINSRVKMQCERCKTEFNFYTIQNMSPTLHEQFFTYPAYAFCKIKNQDFDLTQREFIQSANGMTLYIGYFLIGVGMGSILGGTFLRALFHILWIYVFVKLLK